jgi:hypothetical protein
MADDDIPCIYCTNPECPWFGHAMDASGIPGIPAETVFCGGCTLQTLVDAPPGTAPGDVLEAAS